MALPAVARAPGAGDHGSARGEEWAAAGNDIFTINPAAEFTADQIIQGHKQLIERAHAQGLKIYGCTLNPVKGFLLPGSPCSVFSRAREVKRHVVNAWIPYGQNTGTY